MIRSLRPIRKMFEYGNVCVTGLRGTGKDLLTGNVIARRNIPYVSNVNYGYNFNPLDMKDIDCGRNSYKNFINGNLNYYEFPFDDGTDVYMSDVGVYMPAQYCNELNRDYPFVSVYSALSRHTSNANFHVNCQNLNRIYDKLREQSDIYLRCLWCKVWCGFVIQRVIYYDKYESCVARVKPFRMRVPRGNKVARSNVQIYKDEFEQKNGVVKSYLLIYRNKAHYDTRSFKELLKNGVKIDEKSN